MEFLNLFGFISGLIKASVGIRLKKKNKIKIITHIYFKTASVVSPGARFYLKFNKVQCISIAFKSGDKLSNIV